MVGDDAQQLGARIRALRLARNWTQEQLAERAGVHEKFLGAVERGERNVTLRNIARLARGLGVPIAALFTTEDAPSDTDVTT